MFHHKLLEIEAELAALEQSKHKPETLTPECQGLFHFLENEIEVKLGDKVPKDWKGWISYRRSNYSMVVLRGRAFKEGLFGTFRAALDVPLGSDSLADFQRGFDVSPPQDIDHLLLNLGMDGNKLRVFLWYGENIAAYRLIFEAEVDCDPHNELAEAVTEACTWILKKPKDKTLPEFLSKSSQSGT